MREADHDDEAAEFAGCDLEPEQRIAAAVLAYALRDYRNPRLPDHARRSLLVFLDSELCRFWCAVARIDVEAFRDRLFRDRLDAAAGPGAESLRQGGARVGRQPNTAPESST